ncbi:MAG: TetR/AcrR family transcriptional regulator [Solirubrobacterales bacterium]|nr:TetR/AcrR family transcriptional regulator [Solirubrobacterales bacterium]
MAATNSLFLYSVRSSRNWDEARTSMARARICEAMAHVVGERGYAAATVSDVVSAARISRRTFYEHFDDKEACFLEAYRIGCENVIAQIDDALRALESPDWRTRLRVSLEAWVSMLADEPQFARVLLIDVLGAGPRALAMRERVLADYVEHYRGLRERARAEEPDLPPVPDEFLRALVGGIAELVQQVLLERRSREIPERLRELTDTLVRFAEAVLASRD